MTRKKINNKKYRVENIMVSRFLKETYNFEEFKTSVEKMTSEYHFARLMFKKWREKQSIRNLIHRVPIVFNDENKWNLIIYKWNKTLDKIFDYY